MQGSSFHVLHDHEDLIVSAKGSSQGSDPGMLESRDNFDFPQKTLDQIGTRVSTREQNFHGLDAVGNEVPNLEDLPHPTPADDGDDLVIPNRGADFEGGWACGHQRTVYGESRSMTRSLRSPAIVFRVVFRRAFRRFSRPRPD